MIKKIWIVYPADILAPEMVQIAEHFGLWPQYGFANTPEGIKNCWSVIDNAENLTPAIVSELADSLGCDWELDTRHDCITLIRRASYENAEEAAQ